MFTVTRKWKSAEVPCEGYWLYSIWEDGWQIHTDLYIHQYKEWIEDTIQEEWKNKACNPG